MTDKEIRIAMAIECGWKQYDTYSWSRESSWVPESMLPFYPADLGAMHEAFLSLSPVERYRFNTLMQDAYGQKEAINATARQRAIVFLRLRGKWVEESEVESTIPRPNENDLNALLSENKLWRSELSKVMPPDFKDWWQNSPREWPIVARWCIENLRNRLNLAHNEEDTLINRISQLEKDLENRPTQEEYERVCTSNHALERELAELRHTIRLDAIDKIPKMSL